MQLQLSCELIAMLLSSIFFASAFGGMGVKARTARSPTPPMGWNSYNAYACEPTEDIIRANAQGIVDLGLADLGYSIVTVDCGWPENGRDGEGRLVWNPTLFPSGGKALGDFIHDLGLEFGLYSGAGYFQCGSEDIPASLGFEGIDAQSFAEWGGDTLKYDNCYANSTTVMVEIDSPESRSPDRFIKMGEALDETERDIKYFLCQWGVGEDVPEWAAPLGNTWRMSNDIFNHWRSIWRIVNQAVPHTKHTAAGAFADLDMLVIGLGALSAEEERFHFGLWSLLKSPLIIGAAMTDSRLPEGSLAVMSNKEVIAINQDPLAKAAQLAMRYTEEEWDIWAGDLSGDRKVVGVANWRNESQTVQVDFGLIGVSQAVARDPWAAEDGSVSGIEEMELGPHELRILVLSDIRAAEPPKPAAYYSVEDAVLSGNASLAECPHDCSPIGKKVVDVGDAAVAFESVSSPRDGALLVGIDYINYEYHFHEAWEQGTNTRNMTISVNSGDGKRWAFPLSGGDWYETGHLRIGLDGFTKGDSNSVVFSAPPEGGFGPDIVGLQIYDY